MLLWFITKFYSLIQALHSKDSPRQIALGFAIGTLAGWAPFNVLYSGFILFLLYMLNVNMGFGLLGTLIASILAFLLDPLAGLLGHWVLTDVPFLQPVWTFLFNVPIVPYTRFNNTVMLGSVLIALILFAPIYFGVRFGVKRYRASWHDKVEQWRLIKWIRNSRLFLWFLHVRGY